MVVPERTDSTTGVRTVGIVGAGQLARMLIEAASALGIRCVVLAAHDDEAAVSSAHEVLLGDGFDAGALERLAACSDVVTFDHELVDLEALGRLVEVGHVVRPAPSALRMAVDKAIQRERFSSAGVRVPRFVPLCADPVGDRAAFGAFADAIGAVPVVKAARGGYDGRGVVVTDDLDEARAAALAWRAEGIDVVVEERIAFRRELAALVARRPGGQVAAWRCVETAQDAGVCREVLVPGDVDDATASAATAIATAIAHEIDLVGVMAVELFDTADGLVVNEVALRPHNSGHWTIEGSVTSQFENHLRAVLDLPLGATELTAASVATVNVFGADDTATPVALDAALDDPVVKVHLYAKAPRPGRKLGHVTVVGSAPADDRERAWRAASLLGTPRPASLQAAR